MPSSVDHERMLELTTVHGVAFHVIDSTNLVAGIPAIGTKTAAPTPAKIKPTKIITWRPRPDVAF